MLATPISWPNRKETEQGIFNLKETNPISKVQKLTSDLLSNKFKNLFIISDFQRSKH